MNYRVFKLFVVICWGSLKKELKWSSPRGGGYAIRPCLFMFRDGWPLLHWLHFGLHFGVILGAWGPLYPPGEAPKTDSGVKMGGAILELTPRRSRTSEKGGGGGRMQTQGFRTPHGGEEGVESNSSHA